MDGIPPALRSVPPPAPRPQCHGLQIISMQLGHLSPFLTPQCVGHLHALLTHCTETPGLFQECLRFMFLETHVWATTDQAVQSEVPDKLLSACLTCAAAIPVLRQTRLLELLFNNLRWYYRYGEDQDGGDEGGPEVRVSRCGAAQVRAIRRKYLAVVRAVFTTGKPVTVAETAVLLHNLSHRYVPCAASRSVGASPGQECPREEKCGAGAEWSGGTALRGPTGGGRRPAGRPRRAQRAGLTRGGGGSCGCSPFGATATSSRAVPTPGMCLVLGLPCFWKFWVGGYWRTPPPPMGMGHFEGFESVPLVPKDFFFSDSALGSGWAAAVYLPILRH